VWDKVSLEAILIDPAINNDILKKDIIEFKLILKMIINTHGHGDHIGGNSFFSETFNCPIAIHRNDANMLLNENLNFINLMGIPYKIQAASMLFNDYERFFLGSTLIEVYHTPGHTNGGVVIYSKPLLFTGDTLFKLDIGRTDLPTGDYNQLLKSIKEVIFCLPEDTLVLPGHGGSSTILKEKVANPYFM